jgi:tripartite ATP-independent transporter DctM subunit
MSNEILGFWMLGLMLAVIFIGFPISFTLIILAIGVGYLGLGNMVFDLMVMQSFGIMKEEVLAAVPLFILMGHITEEAGLMDRLFKAFQHLFAALKGSLYIGVILTATIFSMATGIVGAAVTVLGIMAIPVMMKSRYDVRLSAGALAAGGTLGILIPPSVMLVVMGPVLNVSVVKLYAGAFGPGLMLACLYLGYCIVRSHLNPALGPPIPHAERIHSRRAILAELLIGFVPLAVLILGTLGSILFGLATPTEASGIGCLGALILSLAYRKCTIEGLKSAALRTMKTSSMILFLALASNIFGAVFGRLGSAGVMTNTLLALDVSPMLMLFLIMALVFILGWPFEWPAIILLFLPILIPVVNTLKIDMVWFGILTAVNLQTAYLSPPVAMSAYYMKAIAPEWDLVIIYKGMAEFMVIQVIGLVILILFPPIITWLPSLLR